MKNKNFIVFIFFVSLLVLINIGNIYSQVPRLLSYQGQLLDADNQPYNGFITIDFKLYDVKYGGNSLWSEVQNINVENGYFSVFLGRVSPFSKDLHFDKQYYLEVEINKGQMKYERVPLMSSPYAFRSDYSDSSNVSKKALGLEDNTVKLSNLTKEVTTMGGDLTGTFPNPKLNASAIVGNIANGTIPVSKLVPNSVILYGTAAEGDLVGTYPGPFIANSAVTNSKIAANAITTDKIKDFSILRTDLNSEVLSGDVTFANITASNSLKSPNNFLTNIIGTSSTFLNEKVTNSNISSLIAGTISSTISISSPVANFSTSLTSPLVYFGNSNVNNINSGVSTATISYNSPLANITTLNSSNVNSTNGKFENLNVGTASASISYNSPLGNLTNLKGTSASLTNLNLQTENVGTSSASISYSAPLGNFTNLNSTNFTSTFVNANNVTTPNAKITDLTASRITSTISFNTPQLNAPQANFTNLTVGVLSTTLTNTIGVASSGTIVADQGLKISSGGLSVVGNTKLGANLTVTGITTNQDNVLNAKEVITNGKVTNNSDVINNANFTVLGNTQVGDAYSDKFIINSETIFNQNIRFPAGMNGIFAKFNDITVGTASATTSLVTPYARIDNASMLGLSTTNLSTSLASVTISLRTPHVYADTTDINSILARTASVTVSVRTPQLWNNKANIDSLWAGWISSTISNNIGIRASGTVTIDQGLTVKNGGTNLKGRMQQNGQAIIHGNGDGDRATYDDYALKVEDTQQGIAVKVNGSRNGDNGFISFFDNDGLQGGVQGQTAGELWSDPEYLINFISLTLSEVTSVAALVGAVSDFRACVGLGAVVCPPGVMDIVWAGIDLATSTANLVSYVAFKNAQLGVTYSSGSGDYAEYLMKANSYEKFSFGDIVGVNGGLISKETRNSSKFMVVSMSPIVLGNTPKNQNYALYEKVAFMGQVPVKVTGRVNIGDYILPSGKENGTGIAKNSKDMSLEDYQNIVGIAWEKGNNEDINIVNVAVGINQNDVSAFISKQEQTIKNLSFELNTLRKTTNDNYNALSKLVPGFTPNYESIDYSILNDKSNVSQSKNKSNTIQSSINLNNSNNNVKIPTGGILASNLNISDEELEKIKKTYKINFTPEMFAQSIDIARDRLKEKGINVEKHPFFKLIDNNPKFKKEYIDKVIKATVLEVQNKAFIEVSKTNYNKTK